MHPHIQQRVDILAALRQRSNMATADFYRLANIPRPVQPPRFIVEPVGKGLFRITDSVTEKVKGWRRNHNEACSFADAMARTVAA
jgi:hypothetical protein